MELPAIQLDTLGIGAVLGFLSILFLLEQIFPLRAPVRPLGRRLWVNALLSLLTLAVAGFLVRPISLSAVNWSSQTSFGLMNWLSTPRLLRGIIGFVLLDLSFYYWHRLNHKVSFLWRFHNVHHFDPDLDASTGFRFHFGEVALSVFFRVSQVVLIGIPVQVFLLYELIFQMATYFHHSNLGLPKVLDRTLNFLIVTPRMHGIHHSQVREETDSNYSVVFSFWDRLHRTFRTGISQSEIQIGVPGYSDEPSNSFKNALTAPFLRQRDYWMKAPIETLRLVYFEGCPNAKLAERRLREAKVNFEKVCQDSLPDDSPYKKYSSPTLLADHEIIFGSSTGSDGGCSIDLPDAEAIKERLRKIGAPGK